MESIRAYYMRMRAGLTREVLGFEQTYMYEILVTGPLRTSECAGECRFSVKLGNLL